MNSIQSYIKIQDAIEMSDKILVNDTDNVKYVIYKKKLDGTESKAFTEWKLGRSTTYQILYQHPMIGERKITSLIPITEKKWNDIVDANKSN